MRKNEITALGRVSGNITECPDSLLPHLLARAGKQLNKDRDSSLLDDIAHAVGCATGNVGQSPCCLKLELGVIHTAKELDEAWNDS